MNVIGKIIGWFGRKAVLYIALIAAILAYGVWKSGDARSMWEESQTLNLRQADELQNLIDEAALRKQELTAQLAEAGKAAQTATVAELEGKIQQTKLERDKLELEAPDALGSALAKATLNMEAIRREHGRQLRLAFLKRKLSGLEQALVAAQDYEDALRASQLSGKRALANLKANRTKSKNILDRQQRRKDEAQRLCRKATNAIAAFDRSWQSRTLDRLPFRNRRDRLVRTKMVRCAEADDAKRAFERAKYVADTWKRKRAGAAQEVERVEAWVRNELPDTASALRSRLGLERENAANTVSAKASWAWAHYDGETILKRALAALILIIASPFLIRLFGWFVLAPLAMRRASIRLRVPDGRGGAIAPAASSTTSVSVRLQPGEELLVRQDYLQTSADTGAHGTQWFLDWKKPLTSLATGLTFLTRVRGQSETTTISATRDGLAEVTVLELPEGSACVLQPRALAAVAQPIKRPVRITRHWRLGTLNAWLTLQLRYLVFHGPARLVLKGGRGVRVEDAEQGRVFGQDQLVGFSADLAYSVARTETFWPYFFGRQQLLKDRVLAGKGILIIEEAPLSARRGEVRRGLEGMIDAGMKVFGM
jgi:uncharacterized protein (AIM24 family)